MFRNSATLFEVFGIKIKVDASWLIVAALLVWSLSSDYFPQEVAGLGQGDAVVLSVAAMLGLFASLILHEVAHSLVARRFGLRVGSITLFLFGGVAELDEEPSSARSEVLIAVAGPAASLTLAALFWAAVHLGDATHLSQGLRALVGYLAVLSLVLGVFNLMPAFPMDGGRVLRAALWARSGSLIGATWAAVQIATLFAYALILSGIVSLFASSNLGGLWFVLIGIYILVAARTTYEQLRPENSVPLDVEADALLDRIAKTGRCKFLVADRGQLVGVISLTDLVSFIAVMSQIGVPWINRGTARSP